jgi:thiosulfate reductase cytochrome b subunit
MKGGQTQKMDFSKLIQSLRKDKRGVFGLTAVQAFFATILGIALLAYVIVIIMGTLQEANIVTSGSLSDNQTQAILANVSTGVTGFFSSINPIYAILAVLVIILVLVVLVRVVQSPQGSATPQL